MSLITGQRLTGSGTRTYPVQVPDNPTAATVPAVIEFHGGLQDAKTIAARWVEPPNPIPHDLAGYPLVFPETDPGLGKEWVHFQAGDSRLPTLDLEFVRSLNAELPTRHFPTESESVPQVTVSGWTRGPWPGWSRQHRADRVVVQLFQGATAFVMATVITGGHTWPTAATRRNPPVARHFDATATIMRCWHQHAGLPWTTDPSGSRPMRG